jgi:hypothetical protein
MGWIGMGLGGLDYNIRNNDTAWDKLGTEMGMVWNG